MSTPFPRKILIKPSGFPPDVAFLSHSGASDGVIYCIGAARTTTFCQKVDPLKICAVKSDKQKKKRLPYTC